MLHNKSGTQTRGSAPLSMYSLYTGWHAVLEKAQLLSGKTMRQVVQTIAKILSCHDKEKTLQATYFALFMKT